MKTNAEYRRILAQKLQWARNAAQYCRVQAAIIRDKAVSKIYADIAAKADAEADKIFKLDMYYFDRYWKERFGDDTPQEVERKFIYREPPFRKPEGVDDVFTPIVNAHHDAVVNV